MLDRWVNIFFLFVLLIIFILFGQADDHVRIILALVLALLLAGIAFIYNWLTLDGTTSAIIFGAIAFGLGGITGAAVVLIFFISGSVLSTKQASRSGLSKKSVRRDGSQVWANGFWFALWMVIWFISKYDLFLIAAISCIAAATADTWATEIGGNRLKAKTWLITNRKKVEPGTDGGISIYGTLAAFIGASIISLTFILTNLIFGLIALSIIIVTGFLGCMIDSYLGAKIQGKSYDLKILSVFKRQGFFINNNAVNWISTGAASVFSIILILIVGI